MIDDFDDFAKAYVYDELRWVRTSMLSRIDGLTEYESRRPLTRTGTNLLGLIKHLSVSEARYLGDIFGRPSPMSLPSFDDPGYVSHEHMWAGEHESRADVVTGYRHACSHADATIKALPIDAPARVPWWPQPDVRLFNVMVHVLTETNRHAGHADILREQLDSEHPQSDDAMWLQHLAEVEQAASAFRAS